MPDRYDTAGNPEDEYYPETSVLTNLEDIRDPQELLERETELQLAANERVFSLFDECITPDLPFFYYLHHLIFSPLFVWAGRPRTVGISKGGTPFCPPQNIGGMTDSIFADLKQEQWLEGLDLNTFIERAAYYVCEINAVHPFREGNGRATRFYLDVLSARTRGDIFDWTRSSADDYLRACVAGFQQDYGPMVRILKRCASQSFYSKLQLSETLSKAIMSIPPEVAGGLVRRQKAKGKVMDSLFQLSSPARLRQAVLPRKVSAQLQSVILQQILSVRNLEAHANPRKSQ